LETRDDNLAGTLKCHRRAGENPLLFIDGKNPLKAAAGSQRITDLESIFGDPNKSVHPVVL
jgi:hypothetical protein